MIQRYGKGIGKCKGWVEKRWNEDLKDKKDLRDLGGSGMQGIL
jgi:hypothetical protein